VTGPGFRVVLSCICIWALAITQGSAEPAGQAAEVPRSADVAAAVEKYWVAPYKDQLCFVMPWDSDRPERARVCPPGETRQIWLDIDGHKLLSGEHRAVIHVSAKRLARGSTSARGDILRRLMDLAREAPQRSYWYRWQENGPSKQACPFGESFAREVSALGQRTKALPEYVLWLPSAWVCLPPKILPPSLRSDTEAKVAFCLDEYEPVCLTVTNLGNTDLEFDVAVAPPGGPLTVSGPLVRRVNLSLKVWPLRLPESSRMAVYTYNYGMDSAEHVAFLKRMKCNWFSLALPQFSVEGDQVICDFKHTDSSLRNVKPSGKGLFIWSAVMEFEKQLKNKANIDRKDRRFELFLRQYLTQIARHMQQQGWKPEDYAVQLWDEAGLPGRDNPEEVFPLLARAARMMREVEPKIQIMNNPAPGGLWLKYYDMIANETAIWSPHGGTVFSTQETRGLRWKDVQHLDPEKNRNLMLQAYLKSNRESLGTKLWTYFNRSFPYDPIVYYRHMPWKNKRMEFDGVSFFASWYVTGGTLNQPIYLGTQGWWRYALKDLYGWREGVEDIQYLEMVEDAAKTAASPTVARELAAVYDRALKRVIGEQFWPQDSFELEKAIHTSRQELAEALVRQQR